jgi:hypothetical protein
MGCALSKTKKDAPKNGKGSHKKGGRRGTPKVTSNAVAGSAPQVGHTTSEKDKGGKKSRLAGRRILGASSSSNVLTTLGEEATAPATSEGTTEPPTGAAPPPGDRAGETGDAEHEEELSSVNINPLDLTRNDSTISLLTLPGEERMKPPAMAFQFVDNPQQTGGLSPQTSSGSLRPFYGGSELHEQDRPTDRARASSPGDGGEVDGHEQHPSALFTTVSSWEDGRSGSMLSAVGSSTDQLSNPPDYGAARQSQLHAGLLPQASTASLRPFYENQRR